MCIIWVAVLTALIYFEHFKQPALGWSFPYKATACCSFCHLFHRTSMWTPWTVCSKLLTTSISPLPTASAIPFLCPWSQKSQLQLCYTKWLLCWDTSCTHLPTHREFQGVEIWSRHTSLNRCVLGGHVLHVLLLWEWQDVCVCDFPTETEHFKLFLGLGTDEWLRAPPWAWHWEVVGRHTPSCASTLPSNGQASDSQVNWVLPFCLHCSRS